MPKNGQGVRQATCRRPQAPQTLRSLGENLIIVWENSFGVMQRKGRRRLHLLFDLPQCDPVAGGVQIQFQPDESQERDMATATKIRLAALAALAVAFAVVAPTLSALNGNFGAQYSRRDVAMPNAGEQVSKKKRPEVKFAERNEAEMNKHREAEAKIARQSSQLQFLYTYYIWMEICAERFTRFDNTKTELRAVLRSKEAGFPPEQADSIWTVTAEKFRQLEGVLQIAGDAQLYTDCDQNSRYIEDIVMLASRMAGSSQPLLRKKDF
jgi:hypothetical protein